jgi:signal transduction histidine kinase
MRLKWMISCLLLFIAFSVHPQNFSLEDFKVALVGQFIKNIEWPEGPSKSSFTILVPEDSAMMETLSILDGETIDNKRINVQFTPDLSTLPDADLIYISQNVVGNLDNVLALMRGTGTLMVTENSQTLHNVMINIVETAIDLDKTRQLTFQINRPNIVFEQLRIKPDLILHGGSELDVASLYRETEQAMQNLRSENLQSLQELEDKRRELETQQAALQNIQQDFDKLEQRLQQSQSKLERQERELQESTRKLDEVNDNYVKAKQESEQQLAAAQANVEEQINILNTLEVQIADKNQQLSQKELDLQQKEAALADTSERLQEKTVEVAQQAEVIDKQYIIILSSIATLVIFTVSTLIITKLFFKNKKTNQKLQSTLITLENTQEQLIESEKLASLGQLVAGVAHEINTPIGVVVTSSSTTSDDATLCLRKLEEKTLKKSDMHRFLTNTIETDKLIQSNLERCAKLIQNFKQVSADQVVAENRDIRLKDYINDIMGTLSVMLRHSNVKWEVDGENPSQNLDPGLLSQVINNLVNNAINHAFIDVDDPVIKIMITQSDDTNQIDFIDNGIGMDDKTRKKIFDPFFTTKRGRGGIGLGMNIVYNLITSKLRGQISVESEQGEGTTITIKLPA